MSKHDVEMLALSLDPAECRTGSANFIGSTDSLMASQVRRSHCVLSTKLSMCDKMVRDATHQGSIAITGADWIIDNVSWLVIIDQTPGPR
jgi:hypothetical protein